MADEPEDSALTVWLALASIYTGWVKSVVYVSALSLWALVSGHWSAWQAARVEVQQVEDAKKAEKADVPSEVVDALLERTNLEPQPETP